DRAVSSPTRRRSLLPAVLSLRARRREGAALDPSAPDTIRHLHRRGRTDPVDRRPSPGPVPGASRWLCLLPPAAPAPAAGAERAIPDRSGALGRARAADPPRRGCCQDGRLPHWPAVAPAPSSMIGRPAG